LAADGVGMVPHGIDPIPVDHGARRQFAVSRLTGQLARTDARVAPVALAGAALPEEATTDPLAFGSLVHAVLARIDIGGKDGVADWCEHLASRHVVLNAESAAGDAREMIERFAASPRARKLAQAAAVQREVEFMLTWPPGETNGDARYFYGLIDCLYQDAEGRWHLVDYKTNHVAPADVPGVACQYEMQLYVYAMAAERSLGQPPVELALHFLRADTEHIFPWNDATRRRAIHLVNQAIATYLASDCSLQRPVEPVH